MAWRATLLFGGVHVVAVGGVALLGVSWKGVALAAALYVVRMFAITAGLHRYFAHRAFKTSRLGQLALAIVATTGSQMGVLWWVSYHRLHHRHSDANGDPHDRRGGFWWAHIGWFLVHEHDDTQWRQVADLAKFPELRWLDRHYMVPVIALIAALACAGGLWAVVWGYAVSTVLLWHATFSLTSFAHSHGSRRYPTPDRSRNNLAIALVTLGDGWHNNHHHYPRSARAGFYWWEIDATYYALRALAAVGLVRDLHSVPAPVRDLHAAARAIAEARA